MAEDITIKREILVEADAEILEKMRKEGHARGFTVYCEYLRRGNIYFAAEVEETALPLAAQVLPEEVIIWASDYPHERDQRDFSQDIPKLSARKDISEDLKRKILFDNTLRFYPRLGERLESTRSKTKAASVSPTH